MSRRYSKSDRVFQAELEYAEPRQRQHELDDSPDVHHLDYLEQVEHVERELQAMSEFDGFEVESIDDLCPEDHSRMCFMH